MYFDYHAYVAYIYIYILYNYGSTQTYTKLKMCNQLLRVSGNEKKTNITKYFFLKIYRYILIEYFVLNIYTKYWMKVTNEAKDLLIDY